MTLLHVHLRKEHRLRMLQNRVLRRIFGPKREEVAGNEGRLHNEELRNLYISQNTIRVIITRRMRKIRYVAGMGEMRVAYSICARRF